MDLRCRVVVQYMNGGHTIRSLALFQRISKSTVHRWIHLSNLACRRYASRKVLPHVILTIAAKIREDPFVTYAHLKELVHARHGTMLSSGSIHSCLKRGKLVRKRAHKITSTPELIVARKTYRESYRGVDMDSVVSIDESSFYIDMKPVYGYSRRGERLLVPKSIKRDKQRVSLLMAITTGGVLAYHVHPGSINGQIFGTFLRELPIRTYHKYVLMDNVAFHRSKHIATILHSKNLSSLFIPPYTPDYNPIENVFGAMKTIYRRMPFDEKMERRVLQAIEGLSDATCSNSFAHCWTLLQE
jgi:transposase